MKRPTRPRRPDRPAFAALLLLLTLTLGGCGGEPAGAPESPETRAAEDVALRIVTLAPAHPQTVVDLGEGGSLVGIAEHDDAAPDGLPVVGNYLEVDGERMLSVRPTHVLMMAGKEGVPGSLRSLAATGGFEVVSYAYPDTVEEAMDILAPDETDEAAEGNAAAGVGEVLGLGAEAEALRRQTEAGLEALRERTAGLARPRVLMVFGLEPVMASGPGTVLDELLKAAGGDNAAGAAAVSAPTYDREALVAMNPEVILYFTTGGMEPEGLRTHPALGGLPIDAIREGRVHVISDPLALLPSTSVPRVAEVIAAAIHGDF